MSSPYWDGLYSRDAEPPPGLTEIDRASWLRGKLEAETAKSLLQQQLNAQPPAPVPPPPVAAASLPRVSPPTLAPPAPRQVVVPKPAPAPAPPSAPPLAVAASRPAHSGAAGRGWRMGLPIGLGVLLALGVGLAVYLGAASTAGWLLFAAAVVGVVWHLAGGEMTGKKAAARPRTTSSL